MTIEEQLAQAKKIFQDAEKKRIQLETKLESVTEKKKELLSKCNTLGFQPADLDSRISELNQKIENGLAELSKMLPNDDTDPLPF